MKKLLILAYDFPPYVSVGGLRPYSWYKYLKEFDIYPVVITRQWDNQYGNHLDYIAPSKTTETEIEETEYGTIIRTPYKPNLANRIMLKYGAGRFKMIRKTITAYYEFMQWFFPIGSKFNLYREACKYLDNNKVDAVIATGDPFVLFRYAALLSKNYKIPWIADYRDPWSKDKKNSSTIFFKIFNVFNEKRIVKTADYIIAVSDFFLKKIPLEIKYYSTAVIHNGFDESLMNTERKQNSNSLSIAYVGTIYQWHPIESFLRVCNDYRNIKDFNFVFLGINIEAELKELINNKYYNLKNIVNFFPRLSNDVLMKKIVESNVLLLFNYYSYVGTKIYDYLAAKRRILFCYKKDASALKLKEKYYNIDDSATTNNHLQEDIIMETNAGIIVENEDELSEVLDNLYTEFKETGYIACESHDIEKYSRKRQTKKLAEIIKSL